jgi:hypothetical protein
MVNTLAQARRKKTPYIHSDFPHKCRTQFNIYIERQPGPDDAESVPEDGIVNDSDLIIKGNDIYDPFADHGSNTVRNHTVWASLYSKYNVTSSWLRGHFRPSTQDTAKNDKFLFVAIPRMTSTLMYTQDNPTIPEHRAILHHPLAVITPYVFDSTKPSKTCYINVSARTQDVFEYYDAEISTDHATYLAHINNDFSESPATDSHPEWFWHVYMLTDGPQSGTSSVQIGMECSAQITYYTELIGQLTVG